MEKFDKDTYEIIKRLQNARLSLLYKQPFYALLLMHMKFALDITCETAYTDGERIAFNPDFLMELDDRELEFILMHEVLHAALGHPFRKQSDYDLECFDKACDIVVNSNILYSFNMDKRAITFKKLGTVMHKTPSQEEGYEFTVEQVYEQLMKASGKQSKNSNQQFNSNTQNGPGGNGESGSGQSTCKDNSDDLNDSKDDFMKQLLDNDSDANAGEEGSDGKNGGTGGQGKGQKGNAKSNSGTSRKGKGSAKGEGASQGGDSDGDVSKQDLDNLIASLLKGRAVHGKIDPNAELNDNTDEQSQADGVVDDHTFWNGEKEENSIEKNTWLSRMIETTEIIEASARFSESSGGSGRGTAPLAVDRIVKELKNPTLDWRTILNEFVQEEINDYSFSPPDKRMDDCPFFLPDFNEMVQMDIKNILFMIDTSGSMSEKDITECYSEIYGAIQQFNGKLQGKLGFFDAVVVEPIEFKDEEEFKIIRPKGGGGTSFDIIFEYVDEKMKDEPPISIVILTDGYAPFPDESKANGIPVLWIINNKNVEPPWGKVARIVKDK